MTQARRVLEGNKGTAERAGHRPKVLVGKTEPRTLLWVLHPLPAAMALPVVRVVLALIRFRRVSSRIWMDLTLSD
jgi:hypothetical protein